MRRRYILIFFIPFFFFLLLTFTTVFGQHIPSYNLTSNVYSYKEIEEYKTFLSDISDRNTARLDKKIQKQYNKIITGKNDDLLNRLSERGFLFDDVVYPYVNAVFADIVKKNSLDKSQFHVFVDRTSAVNAYSYEDGTIVCNLGLLSVIENESQLTMVLCHELGHYLLNHTNNAIIKRLEKYNSADFLTRVKQIKKQEYNSKKQLEELFVADVFDRRRHSRSQERSADSLGMILFANTGLNCNAVSRVFDVLDSSDVKATFCSIPGFFKSEGISIDESLFKASTKMSFGSPIPKEIVDSIKTHPDCTQRKRVMQSFFDQRACTGNNYLIRNAQNFICIKKIALFDEAAYSKDQANLGLYLYQLIQNNAVFPSDKDIKTEIFNTFLALSQYQKKHLLYSVVSNEYIPDHSNDQYALLLKLLDRISTQSLDELTNNYYLNNKSLINVITHY